MINTEKKAYTSRRGRVGNFLVSEEVIEQEGAETLKRVHVSDVEHGWEVVVPQNYGSAFSIISMALDDDVEDEDRTWEEILHFVFANMFLVTTCMDGIFHTIIRDVALLGFTPAVNKKAVKERKQVRKYISDRLRSFEFPQYASEMSNEEERQAEINEEMKDIIDGVETLTDEGAIETVA